MTGYWVRDLLQVWHKASTDTPDKDRRYLVRCLATPIDVSHLGLPGVGAQICDDCVKAIEREEG